MPRRDRLRVMRLVLLVLLLLAPSAAAQVPPLVQSSVAVAVDADAAPLAVEQDAAIPYTVTVKVEGPGRGSVRVALSMPGGAPASWSASVEPAEHTVEIPPGSSFETTLEGVVKLRPARDAPALTRVPFRLEATLTGNELVPNAQAETNWESRADWRPGLSVNATGGPITIPADGGAADATADVTVTGNAVERVSMEVVRTPQGCAALPPAARTAGPGGSLPTTIRVQCGSTWTPGSIAVRFTHVLMADVSREGEPVEATWDVQASAAAQQERALPLPVLAALAALALAALPRPKR